MDIYIAEEFYEQLRAESARDGAEGLAAALLGPRIQVSHLYPFEVSCAECAATGADRTDGAYCRQCRGAGRTKHIGAMMDRGMMTVITAKLPAKFAPRFPLGLVAPRNPVRIVCGRAADEAPPVAYNESAFSDFATSVLQRMALAFGISYEQLAPDWHR